MKMKRWIKAAGIRALRTVAQNAAAILSTATLLTDADWQFVVSASLLSGLLSLLMSIGGLPELREEADDKKNKDG